MDGLFVPNLTYGAGYSLLPTGIKVFFDTHLMMADPGKYLDDFLSAGCDSVTIHLEAVPNPGSLLTKIREAGALAGLSINPPTPVTALEPWLDMVDLVNVMSVPPGFGGQAFDRNALDKLRWLKQHGRKDLLLEVDGGINEKTIAAAAQAGARLLVVGSAFYGSADRAAAFGRLGSALAAQ